MYLQRWWKFRFFGKPQGCKSPLLFSLYVNDIEEFLADKGVESVDFYNDVLNRYSKFSVVMYADDTLIMANRPENLHVVSNNAEQYYNHWNCISVQEYPKLTLPI